jgi:hypothetical protein
MPTYYRFGLDVLPARRVGGTRCAQGCPEEPIERAQRRSGPFPLQDGELAADCDEFDSNFSTCSEEDPNRGEQRDENRNHATSAIIARPARTSLVTASC